MTSIVCPLCPLHCDDVQIDDQGLLAANGCPIVASALPVEHSPPDRAEFVISSEPSRPLRVVTTGVDLLTARQLASWQAAGRISLTIESDPSIEALLQTASRDGIVSATLADVATHADLVWMIGRVDQTWPRITEKLRLGSSDSNAKQVQRFSQCTADELTGLATAIENGEASSSATGELARNANHWMSSKYAAILVGPGAFASGEESLSATMLARLARLRNAKERCVLLTLDAAATLRSVCLWSSNTSPDATDAGGQTDAGRQEVEFDLRIGSPLSTESRTAKVQLGGSDPGPALAGAYRASAVAGLHRPSMVIRGDGSVSLPLAAPAKVNLLSVAQFLDDNLRDDLLRQPS
ncbi:formylmethanofuran dehydrogenase [Allorhodopirellula heiligendammensis]|uniref:Formylmethanofuran dehydrogenase subunit B n=1 Tax=Allorhodopirellula heiligendammensis TaxID=2714739 RepID=A0A5C6BXB0_9BACT|nr:formylmethanofuran dehydrogenase [Allorhodopirellula heiligendammensis]TWU16950.1 hypothetical protein Poly21_41590 [Allorhodopirellula heiligendammensis]